MVNSFQSTRSTRLGLAHRIFTNKTNVTNNNEQDSITREAMPVDDS